MRAAAFLFMFWWGCVEASAQDWRTDTVFLNDGSYHLGIITTIVPDSAVQIRRARKTYWLPVADIRRIRLDVRFDWVRVYRHGPDKMYVERYLEKKGL
jgi:hypothetical protein